MKIIGVKKLEQKIGRLNKELSIMAINAMHAEALKIQKRSDKNIVTLDLVNFKNLLDSSYVTRPVETTFGWQIEVGYNSEVATYYHSGWDSQEMPPIEPIEEWVNTKLGIPSPEATWIAFAIAENLKNNGHDAEPFFREAIDGVKKNIPRDVQGMLKRWLKRKYQGGVK